MAAMTAEQKRRATLIAELGCAVCGSPAQIHHCFTGGGGRRDHSKIIGLCHFHHQGAQGIHTLGRKAWARIYGTEQELLDKLGNIFHT